MIDINVLLRAISPGGGVDRASSVIADAIKDSNKEKRREFVYEYQKIKNMWNSGSLGNLLMRRRMKIV